MRALTVSAVLFALTADLIPLYALYALLFAEHGLSTAQISSLLAIWSATAFILEIPSGAWADTVSRRGLLILSGVLLAAGFAVWTVLPSYLGFAAGFVLWGTSGALRSGTFEALLYDDLAARHATAEYPRIAGYIRAASEFAALVGILAAAPLYAWGGYALVGWVSVLIAVVHTLSAIALPSAPKAVSAGDIEDLEEELEGAESAPAGPGADVVPSDPDVEFDSGIGESERDFTNTADPRSAGSRYLTMLRTGVREAFRVRMVRRGVILAALLNGITAYDEYFALLADSTGVAPSITALLVGLTVAGALAGAALAGRTEGLRTRTVSLAVAVAGALFITGALVAGAATTSPEFTYVLTLTGFSAIGIAYGIDYNAEVIAAARLQDAIAGPARATVTSVSGVVTEVIALIVFAFVGVASTWLSIPVVVAVLGIPLLLIALLIPAWLPPRPEHEETAGERGSGDGGPVQAGPERIALGGEAPR
ncbi:MFS transporter [Nocardia yamanashiensis]|uniref:MFS transporter n=1 Tax=Nocardia yamanashiensis TaxID=209247 RepID=UPI0009FD097C|nr:MFS transporter [Nocardia yamanashiensis]